MDEEPNRYKFRYAGIIGGFGWVRFATFVEIDTVCNGFLLDELIL
jgi:hypothetical protein